MRGIVLAPTGCHSHVTMPGIIVAITNVVQFGAEVLARAEPYSALVRAKVDRFRKWFSELGPVQTPGHPPMRPGLRWICLHPAWCVSKNLTKKTSD